MSKYRLLLAGVLLAIVLVGTGCKKTQPEEPGIQSYLSGTVTLDPRLPTAKTNAGIEVTVYFREKAGDRSIGSAVTDQNGSFKMVIRAPERGVYPLVISRRDSVFKVAELVVADKDTATFRTVVPSGNRPIIIRSRENGAWLAFKNTRALQTESLYRMAQGGKATQQDVAMAVMQASTIMWSMQETYPGTLGADLAKAQSIVMLAGYDDPLLLRRARDLSPENPGYVEVAKAARRAEARLRGPAAGIDLVRDFIQKKKDKEDQAALNAELVTAYMDNNRPDQARIAARELVQNYPGTEWATWGERAIYDFEHLDPGMPAPPFDLTTVDGKRITNESFRGRLLLLEFYEPNDPNFLQELDARNNLVNALNGAPFSIVSVSVDPDTTRNKEFLSRRAFPGTQVVLGPIPAGVTSPAEVYNVFYLPRRFLIDGEGRILSKYDGPSISILQQEIAAIFSSIARR